MSEPTATPCTRCGHPLVQNEEFPMYWRCWNAACSLSEWFSLRAPAPETPPIDLAAMDNTELLGWVTSLGFEGMPDTDEAMHALGQIIVIASRRGSYVDNKVLREELASTRSELERVRNWPDAFVGWIGGGYNFRGKFPTNLTELNDDCKEFARSAPLQTPEPT